MLSLLTKKNKIKSEWRKVSELKSGMKIAVPKKGVLDSHNSGLINSRKWLGEDDILWDEIESIKHVGKEQVWDIEVDGTHNFVGNDIFAHNTYISGNLGIGTTATTGKLEVALDASSKVAFTDAFNNFQANVYSADAVAPNFVGIKGRGSLASPTAALANDGLMFIGGRGYPSTTINAGAIRILASENFTASAAGTYITFETTPNGSLSKAERMRIDNAGNVGINMTNPSVALDVTGDIEYTGTITDVSDERLKENIIPLTGGLVKVMGIEAKYFNMKDTPDRVDLGFLAQNVKEYVPEAVSIVDPINGYMGVSYTSLIPVAFEAIKELNLNLNAVTGTITPLEGSASETFAKAFFDNVYSKMRTWLASAENGIEDFYANRMRTKELCVGDESGETCITKTQLDTLLANAGMSATSSSSSQSSSSGSSSGDSIAPVITLNGEVTINLNVGDTYNEEGAIALDNVDGNVAVIISGNVDTSTNGIYTITYSATDTAGNNTTLTRTVNVGDVSSVSTPTPEPAPEPTPEPAPTEEIVPVSDPAPVDPAPTTEPTPEPAL